MKKKKISRNSRMQRYQSPRVLIVSEGSKTEPNYFEALRLLYKEISRSIEVRGESPPSPSQVVKFAKTLYQESKIERNKYDEVFCVFDRDSYREDYEKAVQICNSKDSFHAIYSVPCFEYWLLLHLDYTTQGFANCTEVTKVLKEYMPNYDKTSKDSISFFVTHGKITEAIKNAGKNRVDAKKTRSETPMTNVDELVNYLKNLEKN